MVGYIGVEEVELLCTKCGVNLANLLNKITKALDYQEAQ